MIEALLGSALGAVTRVVPEVMKHLDRKNDRKHELLLGDQQYKLVELQGRSKLETATVETQAAQFTQALGALSAAYDSQAAMGRSDNKWVQFWNGVTQSVRPVVTYAFAWGYLVYKINTGTWSTEDTALFAGIINFWFVGRVFEKTTR
jgi:hypothetical protein